MFNCIFIYLFNDAVSHAEVILNQIRNSRKNECCGIWKQSQFI